MEILKDTQYKDRDGMLKSWYHTNTSYNPHLYDSWHNSEFISWCKANVISFFEN